ncbi:phage tail protein [Akkermansia muciniphila]|uniref:hypothetical protein n=1 Tax=Akkermansia muciniphila TaxID=239935 RepID=UPI000C9C60A9|nr:hypothetical protein [Akkermansia muciniphila]PNC83156.1 hypothetical protein CXT92_03620 [Akkermansia muciniphila]PND15966.1 hypothetical protein CXT96_03305 [Akkermansia muciniphila]QIA36329.1 hypothetical protein GXM23_07930 [Akkermansia muciniphila]BBP48752.1 hypothetical protein AKMU_14980 [Akkermansia muciniphila]
MIRCAFNGGELSPTSAVRADLDNFHRGASRIENLDLGQMGGVSRRRGFRRVAAALEGSVILPYVYSTNDRFLVEVSPSLLRVLSAEGDVVASLPSVWSQDDVSALRHKQVNSMLFLACPTHELMVLKRDDEGMFSLAPYEFKARPWRYEEFRDFPVRLTLDEGCYRVSFGEHASDADAAVNEGDVMRVQVTVPQQTGFSTGAVIRQGWVVAGAFTAASSYAAGRKLCINEGSYWSWWTCDRDFNGAADFVDGLTSPADYPEHFHKGVICHSNTITCKGTWTFYCYKEWYGTYAVERRFPNEDWQLLGTSNSPVGAASNLQLTGDEAGEECYLRLMLYESQLSNGSDPSQGFPADSCGNKLVVDAYKKDVVLQLHSLSTSDVRKLTLPLGSDFCDFFEKKGLPVFSALLVDGVKVDGGFEVSREGRTLTVKPDGLTTDDVGAGSMVRLEWEQAEVSLDRFAEGSIEMYRFFLPAGTVVSMQGFVCVYAGQTIQLNSTLNVCSFCEGNGGSYSLMPVFSTMEKASFTVPEDGVYVVRMETWPGGSVSQRARTQLEVPACTAWMEAEAAEVTASAEYSLWDNVSAVPEGVPPSGESLMWSFAAFRGVYGFPSLVDVFQQRLVLAATQAQPQTVWLSKTDDLNSFEVGKQDDSALALTLSTTTQNRICWLMAQSSRLLLGTADAEWAVSGGQGVMTYANARADSHGFVGSSDVPALMATDKVLYVERGGGRVYQYGYDYESDGFVSRDLTVFADHVLADGGGCRGVAFVRKPEPRAVFVRRDGALALMTYNSMHQVHAWHRYTTDGVFEGVAVLPNGDQADLLFALVSREDGRFIEVLAPGNEFQDPGGRDFVSVLETNALISLEAAGRRQHSGGVMFFFGSDALVDGVEVSIDGTRWDVLDRSPSSFLTRGWHSLVADGCWNYDSMVGIRVSGNRDFNLLAIQA